VAVGGGEAGEEVDGFGGAEDEGGEAFILGGVAIVLRELDFDMGFGDGGGEEGVGTDFADGGAQCVCGVAGAGPDEKAFGVPVGTEGGWGHQCGPSKLQ
jgi:hypothetical protein